MFSFRTTALERQSDKALTSGAVGVFASDAAFDPNTGHYSFEVFRSRGNLSRLFFVPVFEGSRSRFDYSQSDLECLDALVIDVQDIGCRIAPLTREVMRLLSSCARLETPPAVYIVDHPNPAGSAVEGGMAVSGDWIPKVALRHGLTLGELAGLYCNEIGAKFPLHVISANASKGFIQWSIPPSSDAPSPLTPFLYSGHSLWKFAGLNPALGTSRPYELFGAPWLSIDSLSPPPCPPEAVLRPCTFIPSEGLYNGEICRGYQIILKDKEHYHSLLHFLALAGYFAKRYSQVEFSEELFETLADPVVGEYLRGGIGLDIASEAIKDAEQKWIRKARRFLLYEKSPVRMK